MSTSVELCTVEYIDKNIRKFTMLRVKRSNNVLLREDQAKNITGFVIGNWLISLNILLNKIYKV